MVRTRAKNCGKRRKIETSESNRNWQALDINILQLILGKVNKKDLLWRASLVCHWWRTACWDVLFWKDRETLDLTTICDLIRHGRFYRDHPYWMAIAIKHVLNPIAVEDRQKLIKKIVFPSYMHLTDHNLLYISQRSPNLKKLILPNSCNVTPSAIKEAAKNWRELEEISIGPIRHRGMSAAIPALGLYCKKITIFRINSNLCERYFRMNKHNATAIIKAGLNLKLFCLENVVLHNDGIQMVLEKCQELEKVTFIKCCKQEDMIVRPMHRISVEINKYNTNNDRALIGWYIDSKDRLHSAEEIVDYLWSL